MFSHSYRNLWNEADPDGLVSLTSEEDPDEPGQIRYQLSTVLAMSLLIVYSEDTIPDMIPAVMFNSLQEVLNGADYCRSFLNEDWFQVLTAAVNSEKTSGYILYRSGREISYSHPVPVLQVLSDAFQCCRVLKLPQYQWDQQAVYSSTRGDICEWMGIGPRDRAYAPGGDDKDRRGEFILAKNENYQDEYLNKEPLGGSLTSIHQDLTFKHGDRLQNLFSRLQESRSFDGSLPGVIALKLQNGFFRPGAQSSSFMPDADGEFGQLQLISDEDAYNLNSVVFALQSALIKNMRMIPYYCLQGPVDITDLKKLLIASVGNVLVIYTDRGDSEYSMFLHSEPVVEMLSSFKNRVQYVFLYNEIPFDEKAEKSLREGNIVDMPLAVLLEQMNLAKNEVTWLDFSTLDIKFSDESREYLRVALCQHSGYNGLIESFLNQYEKKTESLNNVVKDFRLFRDNQLNTKLQHELNSIRRELGMMAEDDPEREEKTERMEYLVSALRGASVLSETKYSATVDWNAELENITGLDKVKEHIRGLKSVFAAKYARGAVNIGTKNVFTFEGNPGCGKTMVARYFAYSLKQDGLITAAEPFHDVKISDIVGVHIGEASAQTDEIFKRCAGSVIFIDEAYSLLDESSYGRSAINAIVKNISSMSPDTVLILADYPADIGRLLKKNRGLESRVVKRITFDDYSCADLLAILKNNLNTNCGLYYNSGEADEIEAAIRDFLLRVSSCGEHNTGRSIGNARLRRAQTSRL